MSSSENELSARGLCPLNADSLRLRLAGKTFLGSHPPFFRYIITIGRGGDLVGLNDAGHYDTGSWRVQERTGILITHWRNGWVDAASRVYDVDGALRFYDAETGGFTTRLDKEIATPARLRAYRFDDPEDSGGR